MERTYIIKCGITPYRVGSLGQDEIFVFGSNLNGYHGGGAAAFAMKYFGAVWGEGIGMTGQCYAIPTMQGGVETIKPYVDQFIEYGRTHLDKFFYVTPIGCGIAGFRPQEIAPLFLEAVELPNVSLPQEFIDCIENRYSWDDLVDYLTEEDSTGSDEEFRILAHESIRQIISSRPDLFQFQGEDIDWDKLASACIHHTYPSNSSEEVLATEKETGRLFSQIEKLIASKNSIFGESIRQELLRTW